MPASSPRIAPVVGSPPEEIHLISWPLRDEGAGPWVLLLGAATLAGTTGYFAQSLPIGLLFLAALWLSLWRLWLPVRYDLGQRGVVETVLGRQSRIGWSHVAGYEVRRNGVLLLATHEPTLLRTLQARYVPWGGRRSQVLEMVRYYLDR